MTKVMRSKVSDYEDIVLFPSDWYCATLDRRLIKALIKLREKHGSAGIHQMLDNMDLLDSGIHDKEYFKELKRLRLKNWDEIIAAEKIIETEE